MFMIVIEENSIEGEKEIQLFISEMKEAKVLVVIIEELTKMAMVLTMDLVELVGEMNLIMWK
jgi:hypothetical protein